MMRVLVVGATGACAQPITINLDPSKTQIGFTLGDVLHTVHGTFRLKSGHLELNPETKAVSGQVVVDATSGESGSAARDSRMRKDILETGRYPEITFTPTGMEGGISPTAPSSLTISGWFQIHGERHQLAVPIQIQMLGNQAIAKGHFVVPYVAWGMKNPSTFLLRVDRQVDIEVTAVTTLAGSRNEVRF
jgi:polyisoprenoid-binding protein YceI